MKLSEAEMALIEKDKRLGALIEANGHLEPREKRGYFEALARSIIGQQISVKAAAKIYERFVKITELKPEKVVTLSEEQIKTIGLSGQKSRYLNDLAAHFVEDSAVFNHLESLNDDAVIAELTKVKGIGVWSAQMFLMFTLGRPDIFAPDDRGLQVAIMRLYDLKTQPKRTELEKLAAKWAPYRSTACLHLWQSLHNTPA